MVSTGGGRKASASVPSVELCETLMGVIESAGVPIFSVDADYRYTSFNAAHAAVMKALYGAEIELGRSVLEYQTVEEDRQEARRNLDRALAGERVVEEAYSGEEDLSRLYFEVLHNPIEDGSEKVIGVAVFAMDITDRKRARIALERSEVKYRALFENMLEGFALCRMYYDDDGRPLDWEYLETNKAFESLTGLKDVVGKRVTEVIPGIKETNPELFETYGAVASTGEPRWFEVRVEQLSVDLYIKVFSPARDHFVAEFENITERKRAERDLHQINTELDAFAHTVSHDLRSPLSSIDLAGGLLAGMLEGASLPPELRMDVDNAVAIIDRNVKRSEKLVNDLLALAEAGQVPPETQVVDVGSTVAQVVEEKQELIGQKGISVSIGAGLGEVVAYPTHVYQVFANLIDNAIRYNDNPEPVVEVSALPAERPGEHRFLVRDNGPGIPAEALDKVFIPFFKGKQGDTGLGLSTVEKIVKVYGGEIGAYNDGGACFEFTLKDLPSGQASGVLPD
ncbi:MAG: PAS domain-containing sensor histidine kinase [Actinobacteria bacterium]|nr:PAS domain-containing sensor histidine kinase [Actinomycetota bacterium]MBU2687998.1 PAS domain-containing sensor histidine kinase [Actinomycetota bacterium]